MIISTDDLYAYGQWARDCSARLTYRSAWAIIMRDKVETAQNRPRYEISDDKAGVIDRAACELKTQDPHLAELFYHHYVGGIGYRALATHYGCSRGKIADQLSRAGGFVIGVATVLK